MATYLYRLGRWSYDRRRTVLGLWLAVFVGVIALAIAFGGTKNNKFEVPGTESQQAQELLKQKYPAASGTSARVVFAAPAGETLEDAENQPAVDATLKEATGLAEVSAVSELTTNKDATIGYADVVYPVPSGEISTEAKQQLADLGKTGEKADLQVEFSGGIAAEEAHRGSESMGMMVAFLVLAITLASLLAAGMPLLTAALGVGIGMAGLTALSGVIDLSETAPILATMLGLAVGIDYALFILARHKQNLAGGMDVRESVAQATGTAGSAVVFAGATVVIALVGLAVVGIPFLTVMGLAAAGTVLIAVAIAISLLPALLGFAGKRLAKPNRFLGGTRVRKHATVSRRWVTFVTRRPAAVLLVGVALLGAVAIPATHMKLGLPDGSYEPTTSTERRSYDLLTEGFGPGFNGTLTVVVDAPEIARQTAVNIDTADRLAEALPMYIGVVVGLALLLLMVVFRSILVPLKAAAGFLLSIAASLGITVWIFQDGNLSGLLDVAQAGPLVSFLPILLIGILFGLAMDYEVFLVSRMCERFVGSGNAKDAVVQGYTDSGRVVIAAATIMMVVFGAYILSPDPIIKSIGLSLAVGILADAFIVRLTLVPAVMALLGRRAWWMPERVEKIVPDLDIEGARLQTT